MVRGVVSCRNRTDIAIQILDLANGAEVTENQLGYNTFLDYGQLKEILNELIESNLLSHDSITRTFRTTGEGHTFLQAYRYICRDLKARYETNKGYELVSRYECKNSSRRIKRGIRGDRHHGKIQHCQKNDG